MQRLSQSPTDPAFVQNPYPFYDRARAAGRVVWWEDYGLPCVFGHAAANQILRDRRFGREIPLEKQRPIAPHTAPFYAIEAHSMLELEPPRHTRLRSLVLRAFTARRIEGMGPEIEVLARDLIAAFPDGPFDLLPAFAEVIPVVVIARLLGVPEGMKDQLLNWSHAMVGMYQAGRTRAMEDAAASASAEFAAFLRAYIDERRRAPGDDLITSLIAAEEAGEKLSTDELISTCVLLLNAGHEATVHAIGNGVAAILSQGGPKDWLSPDRREGTVEEILRWDPPLHMFTRWAYERIEVMGHVFEPGDQVGVMLAAAARDPALIEAPGRFDPGRPVKTHLSFGAGLHFCVGAPLARLEMLRALPVLFELCPGLRLEGRPGYAGTYHFHGLSALMVRR
ncbi:cytochrome P450 [Pararhodobacter aggregans]|uniref:Cytochrome P450 n=1 Tax=Pararhodobacter aggregans TaxID=404875 RepID=A0A2T7UVJ9_9RHOB|nr:cytochrome P450 [Pararhodobacter aggregans]PTX03915.1 unspecific monooxygenase [Pararhodobacter aggregans]PVE48608.1 cytochrome P450 [Pararhodobacter aggregans]